MILPTEKQMLEAKLRLAEENLATVRTERDNWKRNYETIMRMVKLSRCALGIHMFCGDDCLDPMKEVDWDWDDPEAECPNPACSCHDNDAPKEQ